MITNNSVRDTTGERPQPSAPTTDPRAMASDLNDIKDPYAEAQRRSATTPPSP